MLNGAAGCQIAPMCNNSSSFQPEEKLHLKDRCILFGLLLFFFFKDCICGPRDSQTNSIMLQMTDAVNPQTHKKENISNKPFLRGDIFNTDAQTQSLFVLSTAAMHFMRKAAFCLVFCFFYYFFITSSSQRKAFG